MATPQRQVCSCPAAFARAWLGDDDSLLEDMAEQVAEENEENDDEGEFEDISQSLKEFLLAHRPRNLNATELEQSDSKLQRLVTVLKEYFADNPDEKVILFTSFRITAKYLSDRLKSLGMPSLLLWGGMTERDLIIYVQDFLNQHVAGHRFQQHESDNTFLIQLPASVAADLDDFCRRKGLIGLTSLGNALPRQCRFVNKLTSASNKAVESIHQFHPLIRFISQQLNELEEAFYPLVSVKVSARETSVAPGDYMFALRRWTFSGVRDEEWLQSAVCDLSSREPMSDDQSESLINHARIHGGDWLEAPTSISPDVASACLDELEIHLENAYQRAKKRKQDENADRLMFQLHGIDQHMTQRLQTLENVRAQHALHGRSALVKATQGRIEKLRARMGLKREQIQRQESLQPDDTPVCVGLIRVEH